MSEKLRVSFVQNGDCTMLFTDLCKVFDYLPHDHAKLQAYGCNLLSLKLLKLLFMQETLTS